MKNSSKYILALAAALTVWSVAPRAAAQTRPSLGLNFSAGKPTLRLTGGVGTVYSIQYANGLSPTNRWTDRTLLQVQGAGTFWTDPSVPTPSQRFYRAVSVPAPSDTNLVFIQPGTFTMGGRDLSDQQDAVHNERQIVQGGASRVGQTVLVQVLDQILSFVGESLGLLINGSSGSSSRAGEMNRILIFLGQASNTSDDRPA